MKKLSILLILLLSLAISGCSSRSYYLMMASESSSAGQQDRYLNLAKAAEKAERQEQALQTNGTSECPAYTMGLGSFIFSCAQS